MDLFETPEKLPKEVQEIIGSFDDGTCLYKECERVLNELRPHGFTFEYYLDGVPFDLKPIS